MLYRCRYEQYICMKVEMYDIIMHIINLFSMCSQKKKNQENLFLKEIARISL